jgi:hypothetical protein
MVEKGQMRTVLARPFLRRQLKKLVEHFVGETTFDLRATVSGMLLDEVRAQVHLSTLGEGLGEGVVETALTEMDIMYSEFAAVIAELVLEVDVAFRAKTRSMITSVTEYDRETDPRNLPPGKKETVN